MLKETPLVALHRELGGKLVDFGGWNMPLHYGSQLEEHHAVRTKAGWFDVSHMTVVDVCGAEAKSYLKKLLANNVEKLAHPGKALYSAMLNAEGGVIDDLIVYLLDDAYRLVVNCATREKDLSWMQKVAEVFQVDIKERSEFAMVAIQGPEARVKVAKLLDASSLTDLHAFSAATVSVDGEPFFVAATGYTGEDGFEVLLPADRAESFARGLIASGVTPCGLGARDTLRLEAGMNLYGHEMDEEVSPLQANMAWTVAWQPEDREFIGRNALVAERQRGQTHKLVGLVIGGKGVLRADQEVLCEGFEQRGKITSGTFSPTMGTSIALARVPIAFGGDCEVQIRNKLVPVKVVEPCFVRRGKII